MANDVERMQDLKKKIDEVRKYRMQLELENQKLKEEMAELEKELREKYNIPQEKIEEFKLKAEEKLKETEGEINRIYDIIK